MTDEEIRLKVPEKYQQTYEDWEEIRVTEIVHDAFNGTLVVVRAKDVSAIHWEEIAYIDADQIRIFATTEELVKTLESKIKRAWYEKVLSPVGITGIIALTLVVTLCALAFTHEELHQTLSAALLAALGFYFGNKVKARE